uniref:Uncharacterized protein n=1 Tax=Panagrolaimus superbus TaxID=310955 RepID=A0A914XW38_9BILA
MPLFKGHVLSFDLMPLFKGHITENASSCKCPYSFKGTHCEKYDVCVGNPCGENGKCIEVNGLRKCECNPGYYGTICQNQEDTCGFHTHNETGIIEYSRSTRFVELRDSVCQWTIQLFDTRKIIEFRFENFSIPKLYSLTSKGCRFGFANLTIHDGPTADRPLIGGFCHGDNNVPDTNVPFYTSGNAAKLLFYIRLHSGSTYLKMSWKAVEPRCGGRITQTSGTITYFDVHDDDICAWYISVPPQYHIEITLKSAKMASGTAVNCSVNSLELFDHQSAANRTRLIEICENQPKPLIFRTTVPYATIYFKTNRKIMENDVPILDCKRDSSDPWCGVGFVLSYKILECKCFFWVNF